MRKLALTLTAVVAVITLQMVSHVLAADKTGVTISPTFQEISIFPNQTANNQSFAISNNNDSPITFDLSAIDMGALDDSGGVVFSGLSADYQQKYGLAKWIQISQPSLMVAAHTTQNVPFAILNDTTLSPGGHYGAIVVKPQNQNGSQNQINLQPQAATLLFVKKLGGDITKLQLETPKSKTYWWRLPSQLDLTFRNNGNVHVVPRGIVTVKDPHGREVGRSIINPDSSLILPEHTRIYKTTYSNLKQLLWPGVYKVQVQYRFDGSQAISTSVVTYRLMSLPIIVGTIALVVVGAWLLSKLAKRFQHNHKTKKDTKPKPAARSTYMSLRRLEGQKKKTNSKKKRRY